MTMHTTIQISKPMLAGKCEQMSTLRFPVLATPKLDGIRCLKINGRAVSRSFKPISNSFIRAWIETHLPDGVDGELIVKGVSFCEVAGHVGRESGQPNFTFMVFDFVMESVDVAYEHRMRDLGKLAAEIGAAMREARDDGQVVLDHFEPVLPVEIKTVAELEAFEQKCIAEGYEGVMVRTPDSPYKCGRSTEREGWLLKIKRFEDAEAVVLDTYEGLTNNNPAEKDAFGRTKRSSSMENKIGRGELGGFIVRHAATGVEFRLGYNHVLGGIDRVVLWQQRHMLPGKLIKFMHQPSGAKEAPRFPKFIGFRETWDL